MSSAKELGRKIAENQMRAAVENAPNADVMVAQLEVLYWASISILAHTKFNSATQTGVDLTATIARDLDVELHEMHTQGGTEYVSPGKLNKHN